MTTVTDGRTPGFRAGGEALTWNVEHATLRGRGVEQGEVRQLLRRASEGESAMLLVQGERGAGKSALLNYAASEAARQDFSIVAGAGDRLGRHVPFFALRMAVGVASWPADADGRQVGPAPLQQQILQLRELLAQRAAVAPVLICLDDMHWASEETLQALGVLPRKLAGHPLAWILARTRTSDGAGTAAEFLFSALEQEGAGRVTLAPLTGGAVTELLTDAFAAPPHAKLLELAAGAAGNPSLLTALAAGLREEDTAEIVDGRVSPATDRPPVRVDQVARAWLGGLTDATRHMLGAAGVLGTTFRLDDVASMLGETPAALLPRLAEALDEGIVTADEAEISFRHGLVAHAAAGLIPAPARGTLHRQFAEILLGRGDAAAAAAAHLLEAAQPGDQAALAGLDHAAARIHHWSPGMAADLALRALECTPPADQATPRRALAAAEALAAAGRPEPALRIARDLLARPMQALMEARVRCALSAALCASGQTLDARSEARQALAAKAELPAEVRNLALAAELQALMALADDEAGGRISARILASPSGYDEHAEAAALTARAAKAWRDGNVREALGLLRDAARAGHGISPDARHCQPLLALAARLLDLRHVDEAASLIDEADSGALRGIPQEAVVPILRARIHLACGRLDEAAAEATTALDVASALAAHAYAAVAHGVLAAIALRRGDIGAATAHVKSKPAPTPHVASRYAPAECALTEAQYTVVRDGPAAAVDQIRQLCASAPRLREVLLADPGCAGWLVRTALAVGDVQFASVVAGAADELAAVNSECPSLGAIAAHARGLVDQDATRLAAAVVGHKDAWTRGSAAEDLAGLLDERGERRQVVRHLELALDEYGRAGAVADLARIRHRLRRLGVRHRHWQTAVDRPVAGLGSLTDTERAVVDLVAQGLTNRQVAGRMYISAHTVAFHLRQAFRKLNIGSRVELARIIMEQEGRSIG